MITLSLFNGINCGRLASDKAGLKTEQYFSSEIDKYPIAVTQYHYPKTIQLGDARNIVPETLPEIDLLMGGSPCQGFSRAGKQKFFDDPRSQLFFEFVRMLNVIHPKWFLFENVLMKKEIRNVISKHLGVKPVMIDSALVSAQNRKRLYWTNIPFDMPRHRGIIMNDILDNAHSERTKSYCLDANYDKTSKSNPQCYLWKGRRQIVFELPHGYNSGGFSAREKFNALRSCTGSNYLIHIGADKWRPLTPVEAERLQTIPENYTLVPHPHYKGKMMSDSRRFRMIGEAWTVDVIAHILAGIKGGSKCLK